LNLVIDASLTMAWYFDDESTPATDELLDRVAGAAAIVPALCGSRWPTHSSLRSCAYRLCHPNVLTMKTVEP
jgi:hypothetical protein